MMKFEIYILQKKSQDPKMYQEAMGEYLKRLGAYAKVSVIYKKNAKQVEKILKEPGEHYHILPGRDSMTSPGLAQLINESSVQGISKFHFYIGDLGSEEAKPFHVSSFTQSGSLAGTIISDLSCLSDFESSAISQIKILRENTRMELIKMEFKTPTIEDKEEIDRCILADDTRSCDYATANIILWSPFYQVKYAIIDGLFVSHTDEEGGSFCYPLGKGNKKKVLQYFMDDCKEKKIPFVLHGVTHEMEEEFREIFGDIYEIEYDRDISEYIYDREKLATLSGKKLHGKRNHINRFKENHEWSYEPLSDENQLEVLAMLMEWKMQNCDPEDLEKHDEICVSKNCVINYKELGLVGGVLRAEGKVVGFSIGERASNEDTFIVHIEKAFADIQGAYPMINQQFVIHEMEDFKYVNREDDAGEEGLRKSKLSYRPVFMVDKGVLRLKSEVKN